MDDIIKELQVVAEEQRDINNKISLVIANEKKTLESLQARDKELRERLLEAMEANDVKKFENNVLRITYVPAQIRTALDTSRLKEEAPEVFAEFTKETEVKPHLKISVYETD